MKKKPETTIHFVRHGHVHNPQEILYSRLPRFRLSKEGKKEAQAIADYMKDCPIAAVFHSPMLRARQTARYIAAPHDLKLQETSLLHEIYTPYEGRPLKELDKIGWNLYKDIPSEYEQPEDIVQRVRRFCERVIRTYAGRQVAAVTHGDIVMYAQMWARGMAYTHENRINIKPYPSTCSISTLVLSNDFDKPAFRYHTAK